jgi:hypothetical protein
MAATEAASAAATRITVEAQRFEERMPRAMGAVLLFIPTF